MAISSKPTSVDRFWFVISTFGQSDPDFRQPQSAIVQAGVALISATVYSAPGRRDFLTDSVTIAASLSMAFST